MGISLPKVDTWRLPLGNTGLGTDSCIGVDDALSLTRNNLLLEVPSDSQFFEDAWF